jgi:hypothetical protein
MVEPPSYNGAVQVIDIPLRSDANFIRLTGAVGTYAASIDMTGDGTESPMEFIAITLN